MVRQPLIAGGSGTPLLRCRVEAMPDAVVVRVEGEVDLATAPRLADSIADAFRRGPCVIVDLAGVTYLDGSGVAVLERAAESHLARLAVAGPRLQVRRLFDLLHLAEVVPLVASLEAGREYLHHCN
ncbi:MAG TPA: STAS domain-containing protein [bacterium]|nr:STAS domain-containing protein [bacterium]